MMLTKRPFFRMDVHSGSKYFFDQLCPPYADLIECLFILHAAFTCHRPIIIIHILATDSVTNNLTPQNYNSTNKKKTILYCVVIIYDYNKFYHFKCNFQEQ